MPRPTVLIGFAEALAAPETAWSLIDGGYQVAAFARRGQGCALRHSRYVTCHEISAPESNLEAALAELRSLMTSLAAKDSAPRILLPLDDKAVWLCNAAGSGPDWLTAGPSDALTELALDKRFQIEAATDAGFDVPQTLVARNANDVLGFVADRDFPVILRPAECVPVKDGRIYSCRKWVCADQHELEKALAEWNGSVPLLVQPFIEGTGEGVFGLATPNGIRAWSAHRRLRMMNPQGSGSSACISAAIPGELKTKAEALIQKTGWRGLFMIELLRDRAGTPWFVELNGRSWGSMALSRRQGLEYPAWQVKLRLDPESPAGLAPARSREVVCRNAGREFMHLLFVLRGARSKALRNWPSFWKAAAEVIRIRRRDTFYNWRRDDWRVFFADFYYTVRGNVLKGKTVPRTVATETPEKPLAKAHGREELAE